MYEGGVLTPEVGRIVVSGGESERGFYRVVPVNLVADVLGFVLGKNTGLI